MVAEIACFVLSAVLLGFASVSDGKTGLVANRYPFLLLLAAVLRGVVHVLTAGDAGAADTAGAAGVADTAARVALASGRLLGAVFCLLLFAIPACKNGSMGGADVKIAAGLGLYWGFPAVLTVLCAAFMLCLLYVLLRRIAVHIRLRAVPFVPFLTAGHVLYAALQILFE